MTSPLNENDRRDHVSVVLTIIIVPVLLKVTPVAVDQLKYIEPVALADPDKVVASKTLGVLKVKIAELSPFHHADTPYTW